MNDTPSSGITIRRGPMASDVLGKHFTQIYNRAMRDERLTYRARGVLGSLLTHTDGYGITIKFLVAGSPKGREGRDAIADALRELEEFGYLHRERVIDPVTKRRGGMEYQVTDMPDGFLVSEEKPWSKPGTAEPSLGNTAGQGQDTDFQGQDFQEQGNQPLESSALKKTNERTPTGEDTQGAAGAAASVDPDVVDRVCKALAAAIQGRGVKRPKITYAWKDAARELLTPDEDGFAYTVEEIEGGIAWAMADKFWASRVPTMKKFAEHFGKIMVQARGEAADPTTGMGKEIHDDLMERRLKRMDEVEQKMEAELGRPLTFTERKAMQEFVEKEVQ